jgi:hypothetical protein
MMNKHYDPQWQGKCAKVKRTETPFYYTELIWTDVVFLEYNRILLQLITYYNSKECLELQNNKKVKLMKEIQRLTKDIRQWRNEFTSIKSQGK